MGTKIATKDYWISCYPLDKIDGFWTQDKELWKKLRPLLGSSITPKSRPQHTCYKVSLPDLREIFKLIDAALNEAQATLDRKQLVFEKSDALSERINRLGRARAAVIASVDARSRKNVLGIVTPITHEKTEKLEEDKTYTVFIHTLNGQPAVFLGDRIETLDGELKFKNAKGTKYETPTTLNQIKFQLRTARKAMIASGRYTSEEIFAFDAGWGWVSYKIRGNSSTVERKGAKAK